MSDPMLRNREEVQLGKTMPAQDMRLPLKHALLDLGTDLKAECEKSDVSYNAATKAQSGDHQVANVEVKRLFQRLLHRWKPSVFAPANGQADRMRDLDDEPTEPEAYVNEAEQRADDADHD